MRYGSFFTFSCVEQSIRLYFSEQFLQILLQIIWIFMVSFENYFNAKKILFDSLSPASNYNINADDKNGKAIIKDSKAKLISYGSSEDAGF